MEKQLNFTAGKYKNTKICENLDFMYLCKALQHNWKHITNKHRKQISERVNELIKLKQTK